MKKPNFKTLSVILSFLFLGVVSICISNTAFAIRFHSDDDGFGGMQVKYPGSEITVKGRDKEILSIAKTLSLAALVPHLSQFASVMGESMRSGTQKRTPRDRAIAYLDHAANLLVGQAPPELQFELRQAYFIGGEKVVSSDKLWRESGGWRLHEGLYFGNGSFSIVIAYQLANSPILQKMHRLLALVEVSQTAEITKRYGDIPYRYFAVVAQQINQITNLLLLEEFLTKIDSQVLRSEIEATSLSIHLRTELELKQFLNRRVEEILLLNPDLKSESFTEWIKTFREVRNKKARELGNGSALLTHVGLHLRGVLGRQNTSLLFRIANEARSHGDELLSQVARELIHRPLIRCESLFLRTDG